MPSNINACNNLLKCLSYENNNLSMNFISLCFREVLSRLNKKLNNTKPEAQPNMHDENSKIPCGTISNNVCNKLEDVATK